MFASLVQVLEKVERSRQLPSNTSQDLLSSYRQLINEAKHSDSDHALFRLLFPVDDHRRKYDLAERRLATSLADCLGLSETKRGERLLKWKQSTSLDHVPAAVRDLGTAVQAMLQDVSCIFESDISLDTIDELLDEMAQLSHFSSADLQNKANPPRTRRQILRDLFCTLSPVEAKWLTRIILRTSQTYAPISKWTITNLRYWFMTDLFSVHNEFDHVLNIVHKLEQKNGVLSRPEDPLHLIALVERYLCPRIGHRVEMIKCEKGLSSVHVHKLLQQTTNKDKITAWAEIKYDGERMQIHVDRTRSLDKQIVIFSKSGRESTTDRHLVLPNIREALALDDPHSSITTGIFEAELLVYDDATGDIAEFDKIKEVMQGDKKHRLGATAHMHPLVMFFDCLMVNDQSLLHAEYNERRAALEKYVHITKTRAEIAQRTRIDFIRHSTSGIAKLQKLMAEVVASRKEGLVIKPATSTYFRPFHNDATPIHWRGQHSTKPIWIKFKNDYIPGFGDTADFAILGGSYNPERAAKLKICREGKARLEY